MVADNQNTAEDDAQIRNLIATLAHCADEGDEQAYSSLFAEDAVWEIKDSAIARGLAEIMEGVRERWAKKITGPDSNTRHVITTSVVTLQGNSAEAKSVFQFYANVHKTPNLVAVGTYEDKFVRSGHRWQLARRLIHAPEL